MEKRSLSLAFYLRIVAAAIAATLLGVGAARALWHLNDLSGMRHIAGDWMALAQSLNGGVFYPRLEENGYYAGTRYMPLFFSLIAGLEHLIGDYLLATKLVTLFAMLGLTTGIYAVVRRVTGRWLDALAMTGLVLAFPEGLMALLSPHADALAVALSVWGLYILASEKPRTGQIILAALLLALAFGTKFSAVAAPTAAVIYLLPRQAKGSVTLAVVFVVFVLAGLGLMHFTSQGRFEENFRALGSGGMTLDFMASGPSRLFGALLISSLTAFVAPFVVLLALATVVQNGFTRGLTLWDWYFLAAIGTTLLILMSPGTDINHLLELEIASVLVVAQRWGTAPPASDGTTMPRKALVSRVLLLLPLLIGGYAAAKHPEKELLRDLFPKHTEQGLAVKHSEHDWFWQEQALTFPTLAEQLPPNPHLLTEDSTPVVLLGQRPVVMDAFAFRILAEQGLIDDQQLVERILRREFNGLIMLRRLENPNERLTTFHFGEKVTSALRKSYRFHKQVGQYFLYLPTPAESEAAQPARK